MPFSKYISQSPRDFGRALGISGFYLVGEPEGYPLQEPFVYDPSLIPFSGSGGISPFATAASGEFFTWVPTVHWNVINPVTNAPFAIQELQRADFFQGCDVFLLDETGLLVRQVATGYKGTSLRLDTSYMKDAFVYANGDEDFTALHTTGRPLDGSRPSGEFVGLDPRRLHTLRDIHI